MMTTNVCVRMKSKLKQLKSTWSTCCFVLNAFTAECPLSYIAALKEGEGGIGKMGELAGRSTLNQRQLFLTSRKLWRSVVLDISEC